MTWRKLSFWRITVALSRGALEWWSDPRRKRQVLRSRTGAIYEYRYSPGGYLIRRIPEYWGA